MRQIKRTIAVLTATIIAMTLAPVPAAQAAQPSIVVEAATISYYSQDELFVNGYATCSQPIGQAQIEVSALQLGNGPVGFGFTTFDCSSPYRSWGVYISSGSIYTPWLSGYLVAGNVKLILNGVVEAISCPCITAW